MLVMQNIDAVNTDLSLADVVRLIPMAIRCTYNIRVSELIALTQIFHVDFNTIFAGLER